MSEQNSPIKQELLAASEKYKEDIRESLKNVGDSLGKNGINALVIGGSLVGGYMLYKFLSRNEKKIKLKKKPFDDEGQAQVIYEEEPSLLEKLTEKILEEALVFLLSVAKDQLVLFLEKQFKTEDDKGEDK